MTLVDLDDVCLSNVNRQSHALRSTLGQMKAHALRDRVSDINPECVVSCVLDFVAYDDVSAALPPAVLGRHDVLVDCVDDARCKAAILDECGRARLPVVTVGASGNRGDPTKIEAGDITKAKDDRLLFWVRKICRKEYG